MSDIKLALIAPEFLPNWGGVGTYCVELARRLKDKLELHVITLERDIKGQKNGYSRKEMLDYFDNKLDVHILTTAKDTFLYNSKFQYKILREMPELEKEFGLELMHTHHAHMSDVLYKLRGRRMPSVTTIHTTIGGQRESINASGLPFSRMESSEKWQVLLYRPLKMSENFSLKRCNNFITVSKWMREYLLENYPHISKNITSIYNGIDPEVYKPENKKKPLKALDSIEKKIALFSSRMTTAKGAHYLINAIPKIIEKNRDIHFVFTGAKDNEQWIAQLKRHGVGPEWYTFLGYLDYNQLPTLYAKADMYLLPTLYENFPFRMIEAMASGTPVIGTNICAIPEAIEHEKNGLLIPPKNVEAIVDGVLKLMESDDYLRNLGDSARKTALEKFSWDGIIESIVKVYEKILA